MRYIYNIILLIISLINFFVNFILFFLYIKKNYYLCSAVIEIAALSIKIDCYIF